MKNFTKILTLTIAIVGIMLSGCKKEVGPPGPQGPPGTPGTNANENINIEIFRVHYSEWSDDNYLFHPTSLLTQSVVDSGAVFLYFKFYWEGDSIWVNFIDNNYSHYAYKLDTLIMLADLNDIYPNDSDSIATFKLVTISHNMEYKLLKEKTDIVEYLKNLEK